MSRTKAPRYFTVADLPSHPLLVPFGLTERRLRRIIGTGRLVGFRVGKYLYFTDDDIARYVASCRTDAEASS